MKPTLLLLVVAVSILSACAAPPPSISAPTFTPSFPPTDTTIPTETAIPSDTPTATLAATLTLGTGSNLVSPADGMVLLYVPEGPFPMGSTDGYSDEGPVHAVNLSAFWIDRTEVTNGMYALCVSAGACARPRRNSSNLIDYYYGFEEYVNWPVIFISWQDASNYCTWAGRRLPTEAEWEKAARGIDGRPYPWGSALPDISLADFDHNLNDVNRVGSYPAGASPYGALDMAGNVLEWTADWYGRTYYASSPELNPTGPGSGDRRVARGGSWTANADGVRSTRRYIHAPDQPSFEIGFRCAVSAQP